MGEQAPPGWYPDSQGNERYWDGAAWTEHVRPLAAQWVEDGQKIDGAFSKLGGIVKKAAADRKSAREAKARSLEEAERIAGALVTSGVFGTSTIEIYANGYVRVASWPDGAGANGPKPVTRKMPYERLHSISFAMNSGSDTKGTGLTDIVGPAVSGLVKGGTSLMKATAGGFAVSAATSYIASNVSDKSALIITTDAKIHTLSNQVANAVGIKVSQRPHNDVGRALEAAGNRVLGHDVEGRQEPEPVMQVSAPMPLPAATAEPTLADRLRELATLHSEGILSEEEFTTAKSRLLGGL